MTSMRIILVLAAWGLTALANGAPPLMAQSPPAPAAAESFLADLSDIPLMPGLTQDEAASFLFDKPAGRILTARLHGCVEAADVRHYYGATLPQLGWLPAPSVSTATASTATASTLIYQREGERLTLEFSSRSDPGTDAASGTRSDEDDGCFELLLLLSPAAAGE